MNIKDHRSSCLSPRTIVLALALFGPVSANAEIIWSENFEGGWGLWSASNGVWSVGTPSVGPRACFGGLNCAATGLASKYPLGTDSDLLSPPIQLQAISAGEELHLRFWQWVDYYTVVPADYGAQYISDQQDPVTGVWLRGQEVGIRATLTSNGWTPSDIDISAYAGKKIQLQFGHYDDNAISPHGNGPYVAFGRYIDNITIERISPTSGSANLSVNVSATPEPVPVSGALAYTYTVINQGPSGAHRVNLTMSLSKAVDLVATPISGCALAGNALTCPLGDLGPGGQINDKVTVAPKVAGSLTNNALLNGNEPDPDSTDNTFAIISTVVPLSAQPDLAVTVQDAPDPVMAGNALIYTLSTINLSSQAATGVTFTAALPAGVDFLSASAGCGATGGTVTCAVGDLVAGGQAQRNITVRPTTAGTLNLTASVSGSQTDSNSANNSAAVSTTVSPTSGTGETADLSLAISDQPDPATVGQPFSYLFAITNGGPAAATGISLSGQLPAGFAVTSLATGCSAASGLLTCGLGDLQPGQQALRSMTATPSAPGTLTLSASVTGSPADPNPANNQASADTTVQQPSTAVQADLAVTLSDHPDPAMVNGRIIYVLTALNDGPDPATGITASMALPNGLAYVSASEGCIPSSGAVICTLPDLPRGSQAARAIVTNPTAAGNWITTALVSAQEYDRESADNTATAITTVVADRPAADLAVSLNAAPKKVRLGKNLTYTAKVQNLRKKGSARQADGVVAILELPGGFSVLTASRGCLVAGTIVTCELGTLRRGAARTLKIVGRPGSAGALTTGVRVTGSVNDRNLRNNSMQVRTAAR